MLYVSRTRDSGKIRPPRVVRPQAPRAGLRRLGLLIALIAVTASLLAAVGIA